MAHIVRIVEVARAQSKCATWRNHVRLSCGSTTGETVTVEEEELEREMARGGARVRIGDPTKRREARSE